MIPGCAGDNSCNPVRPPIETQNIGKLMASESGVSESGKYDMIKRADDLVKRITELEEKLVREEGRWPVISPVPDKPTDEEVREHNATHTPPKPWCPYCAKATAKRDPHRIIRKDVPDVEASIDKVPTISVGFMYLFNKGERPTLVMVDHDSGRVWTYAPKDKAILSGEGWIQRRIVRDIDNAGHKSIKRKFKSDQENSIVALQHEVQRLRSGRTIPINSPVGESESNGRVENAIPRVQDKVRTLKAHVKGETGLDITSMDGLMSWLTRWAGELITRYSIGKDGKTAQERLKGQASTRPIAQFGEHVLYLPLETPSTEENKVENKLRDGIWLGVVDRTEGAIVGTEHGTIKCRTVKRRPEGQQRSREALEAMKGTVQQPAPGSQSDRIPTRIVDDENKPVRARASGTPKDTPPRSQPSTRLAKESDEDLHQRCGEVWCHSRMPGMHRGTNWPRQRQRHHQAHHPAQRRLPCQDEG